MSRRLAVFFLVLTAMVVPGAGADAAPAVVEIVRVADVGPGLNGVSLRATCPRRTQVISGGVQLAGNFTNDEVHIVWSFPFDGRDRGKSPDDG